MVLDPDVRHHSGGYEYRYSTISRQLLTVAHLLLSLEAGEQQQELLRNIVVAASKGAKHQYLLEKLRQHHDQASSGGALSWPDSQRVGLVGHCLCCHE